MDEYRDNQVKKLMMKRRKKKRIKVIRLFFVLGIIGFVFFILLSDIMKIKTIHVIGVNDAELEHPASNVQEIWIFEECGRGTIRSIMIYDDGQEKESSYSFSWILTVDLVIVIEGSSYWTIDDLTDERLRLYYTPNDPIEMPGQPRKYYEFFRKQF